MRSGDAYKQWRQCLRKIRHESRREARKHEKRLNKLTPKDPVEAYKCPYCKFWHVGHPKYKKGT